MELSKISDTKKIESINNKVEIKYVNVKGKHYGTFVRGLHHFMKSNEIDQFVLLLKKKLGAGMSAREFDDETEYGFQGDHKDRIKQMLVASNKIKESEIVMDIGK